MLLFFGEFHQGIENSCGQECNDIDKSYVDSNCYDITKIIDIICDNCKKNNNYVDIYIEHKIKNINDYVYIPQDSGFLGKIIETFLAISKNVRYDNARFHYIDIRDINELPHYYIDMQIYVIKEMIIKCWINSDTLNIFRYVMIPKLALFELFFDEWDSKLLNIYLFSDNYTNDIDNYVNDLQQIYYDQNLISSSIEYNIDVFNTNVTNAFKEFANV